ncbi:sce7725 family protein [Pseudomonas botevensis]|uniref:sce7725 family protein n=1 Tax=Pseudomonas botevensis TaxID=2842352 RepID=UPI001C3C99EC|nr:sce7725 family protein [Pseudomonas botevensis]MBV4475197.1 sce7725 family protein [Pseudomonas botevensis]
MYYPILKAKRHELNTLFDLAPILPAAKYRPVIEPVNAKYKPLIATIEQLHSNSVSPLVVINPSQGHFAKNTSAGLFGQLQADPKSANKFVPCIKVKDAADSAALSLLASYPNAAIYLENDIGVGSLSILNSASCVLLNQQKVDESIVDQLNNVVVYSDSFAKKKRNADYTSKSFYSGLHVSYKKKSNVSGFGDFTIMGEEYLDSGGPAYVVAIHVSYIDNAAPNSMHVHHYCSTVDDKLPTNAGSKYKEALVKMFTFIAANPTVYDNTLGLGEFRASHSVMHFPGLGLVKEMSMKHHIESLCNYI